jgi:hypothetical protein
VRLNLDARRSESSRRLHLVQIVVANNLVYVTIGGVLSMMRITLAAMKIVTSLFLILFGSSWLAGRAAEPPKQLHAPEMRPVVAWSFDRARELEGWRPNAHCAEVQVSDGALDVRTTGPDPILELQAPLGIPASPWQYIEVRLKADHDGTCEFFWSNTREGPFGGFTQEKTTGFHVTGDSQWRTYRLMPFWQAEGKIIRLRLDLFNATTFSIDHIRVVELAMPALAGSTEFDFAAGACGWQALKGAQAAVETNGLAVLSLPPESMLLAPPISIAAHEQAFASVTMAVFKGQRATLYFASDRLPGQQSYSFPIIADGRERRYNIDLLGASGWRGTIRALGLRPTDASGRAQDPAAPLARVRSFTITAEPGGPPELHVAYFGFAEAMPRAGVPLTLRAVVSNQGGTTATNVLAELRLPSDLQILDRPHANGPARSLAFGEEVTFTWRLEVNRPFHGDGELRVSAAGAPPLSARSALAVTPRLAAEKSAYVPEPRPVRGPYEVGVYYFPGWKSASQWHPLERFPERRPVLGNYREGDPEIADWHIKWAVEHGITFFAYDWYWSQGARQLEHALHEGYFQARYRSYLKFCLLWANHNAPKTSSLGDCLAVTRHWIEQYFRRPEHLLVHGKPVVIIFSTERLTSDLGSAGVKEALAAMRAECRKAGLPGLYILACVGDVGQARAAAAEGYDAVTAYNWPGLGLSGGELYGSFEALLEPYRRQWLHIIRECPIPLALPICGGWDSRPWHGENHLVRFGRTPALFKRHLADARRTLQEPPAGQLLTNLVLIEAWNEWGEGSYIEPHREFGFGYLDAVREVFTGAPADHLDLTPADAGLGPYDVPQEDTARTAWDFGPGITGWENTMDLTAIRMGQSGLTAVSSGRDPALFGPPVQVRAREFSQLLVRMRLLRADKQPFTDSAQLFWRTERWPEGEASSKRFPVRGDGQWHLYQIPLADSPRWKGVITRLRLDPCNQPGVEINIREIRLRP